MRPLAALCALALAAPAHATRETLRFDFGALSRSSFSIALSASLLCRCLTARRCSLAPPARRRRLRPRALTAAARRPAHARVPGEAQERLYEPARDLLRPAAARHRRVERGGLRARVLLGRELPDLPVGAGHELVGARRRLLGRQVRRRPAREHDVGRRHALPARQAAAAAAAAPQPAAAARAAADEQRPLRAELRRLELGAARRAARLSDQRHLRRLQPRQRELLHPTQQLLLPQALQAPVGVAGGRRLAAVRGRLPEGAGLRQRRLHVRRRRPRLQRLLDPAERRGPRQVRHGGERHRAVRRRLARLGLVVWCVSNSAPAAASLSDLLAPA